MRDTFSPSGKSSQPLDIEFILWCIALGLLVIVLLAEVARVAADFSYPAELTYTNAVSTFVARRVEQGEPLYSDVQEPPHVVTLYGPLFYLVPGLLGRIVEADETALYRLGRGVSLVATMGALGLVFVSAMRFRRCGWREALLATVFIAVSPILWPTGFCFRPDVPEVFFELLGLGIVAFFASSRWRFTAIVVFVTGFLFKQTAVVGVAATIGAALLERRWRDAAVWALLAVVAYGGAVICLNALTEGQYSYHAFTVLRGGVMIEKFDLIVGRIVLPAGVFIWSLAGVGLIRALHNRAAGLFDIALVIAVGLASLTVLRGGSAENYFIKPLFVAGIVAGTELIRWRKGRGCPSAIEESRQGDRPSAANPACLLALALAAVTAATPALREAFGATRTLEKLSHAGEDNAALERQLRGLAEDLNRLGGPVWSQYNPLNLYLDRPVLLDSLLFAGMVEHGTFDDAAVLRSITEKEISAVVLAFPAETRPAPGYQSAPWVSPRWLEAMIEAGYQGRRSGSLFIYLRPQ